MNITLFIGSLSSGGAEKQILMLANGLLARGCDVRLVTIFPGGLFWDDAKNELNSRLIPLNSSSPSNKISKIWGLLKSPFLLRRVLKIAKDERPVTLYSMLHLSNLIAFCASRFNDCRLVWGYRASNMRLNWKRSIPQRVCACVSPSVELLISNSEAGVAVAHQNRFRSKRIAVIRNGVDDAYWFKSEDFSWIRSDLKIPPENKVVGIVARFDPMKGYDVFLEMAVKLRQKTANISFIIVGTGNQLYRTELERESRELGLEPVLTWILDCSDPRPYYSIMDVFVSSSSYGEGCPNVVLEAQACGAKAVVTDVGDSKYLVESSNQVVAAGDVEGLATKVTNTLHSNRHCSRDFVVNNFSVDRCCEQTLEELRALSSC